MRREGGLFISARVFLPVWCHPWMDDETDEWMEKASRSRRPLLYVILVWTPCLMHRCVISTIFGSCFSFFFKLLSFLFFYFYVFSVIIIICIIKIKYFFFTFVFLFIWMRVRSLEKEDTPRSFSSRVFLHYYKFYFFLFSTLYLVSSFL
jgi:hypothetical protein